MTERPRCPQPQNFSVVTGFLTPGSDTGPGALDGSISVDVLDPTENNERVRAMEVSDRWSLEVDDRLPLGTAHGTVRVGDPVSVEVTGPALSADLYRLVATVDVYPADHSPDEPPVYQKRASGDLMRVADVPLGSARPWPNLQAKRSAKREIERAPAAGPDGASDARASLYTVKQLRGGRCWRQLEFLVQRGSTRVILAQGELGLSSAAMAAHQQAVGVFAAVVVAQDPQATLGAADIVCG